MSIVKWIKNKMISYFGLEDEKYKFLNKWFIDKITKLCGVKTTLNISLEVLELLYNFLNDRSTITSDFSKEYKLWKLVISTKLKDGYCVTIHVSSNSNSITFIVWKYFNYDINSKAFSLLVRNKDSYKLLMNKINTVINDLEVEDSYNRRVEVNEELKKLNSKS